VTKKFVFGFFDVYAYSRLVNNRRFNMRVGKTCGERRINQQFEKALKLFFVARPCLSMFKKSIFLKSVFF
tara:strand:- start:59 stop:268 length:210 start_codon:yes stop_codon:yes gene_type:complete